jgi:phosphomannomutase
LLDVLNDEIYPKFGYNFTKSISYYIKEFDWKTIAEAKMDKFRNYHHDTIAWATIQDVKWNDDGNCLEWSLPNHSWIKFRASGTEPKFKAYFCVYGDNNVDVYDKYTQLQSAIEQLFNE